MSDGGPDLILARLTALREPRMRVLLLVEALGAGEPDACQCGPVDGRRRQQQRARYRGCSK